MMTFDIKYRKTVDISDFDYEDLANLEEEIAKRKKELKRAEYKGLVDGVINAIEAIKEAGFDYIGACYDNNGESYNWDEISFKIQQEYTRKEEEDY